MTDPVAVGGRTDRATIQGDARVIEEDPHGGWERLLPIWEKKEPSIVYFLKQRVALPLFFERSLIEITPRRALYWAGRRRGHGARGDRPSERRPRDGRHRHSAADAGARRRARASRSSPPTPTRSSPSSTPTATRSASRSTRRSIRRGRPRRSRRRPGSSVPTDADISLTGSHIRPQPGYGYDERRHVTVWGRRRRRPTAETVSIAGAGPGAGTRPRSRSSSTRSGRSASRGSTSTRCRSSAGTPVKPRLSFGWLVLRTTRLPFLSATIVPVLLGIVIAARQGSFDLLTAVLTVIGASFVQLGLNVANDVFDTVQGADDANVTPTKFSGGSRVIQYGLVSFRQMAGLATIFYVAAA